MQNDQKQTLDTDQRRLDSSQTTNSRFILRYPKAAALYLLVILVGVAAFVALKH